MPKPPKPTNFECLDPDAPGTKRIIDAALTVCVPWEPEQAPVFQRAKIADLAEHIDQRAQLLEDVNELRAGPTAYSVAAITTSEIFE
jgi:hypothetical protein